MAVADVSNSGLTGQKAKALSATVGGVQNANFTNTATGTYSADGKNYKYVTFTGSGTLTIDKAGFVDMLIVGGAGNVGCCNIPGHGGAGGMCEVTAAYLSIGSYTVVVGAGGAVRRYGSSSYVGTQFFGFGGGAGGDGFGGGTNNQSAGGLIHGGSGGGVGTGFVAGAGGAGVPGQGNNGAGGDSTTAGGGGGGAGGVGTTGVGGAGKVSSITGTPVTYAVGGPTGGGTANRGNGNGGSGIVVVRVQI